MRMRRGVVYLLAVLFGSVIGCLAESKATIRNPLQRFTSSLLPPTPNNDVALIVDVDGKFYLIDSESRKIKWSWSSSLPIYSSYQNIPNSLTVFKNPTKPNPFDVFVDCGDDWQLYFYRNGTQIAKVPLSAEDYVRTTPIVSTDGGVTLGSRKTTVFVVDADSGDLIRTFKLPDTTSNSGGVVVEPLERNPLMLKRNVDEFVEPGGENVKTVERLLYIKRTDYSLQHHSPVDGEVLWSVSFAEIDASFGFPGFGNELDELHKVKPVVLRTRDRSSMESLSVFDGIVNGLPSPSVSDGIVNGLPSLSVFDGVVNGLPGRKPLPLPSPEHSLVPRDFHPIPMTPRSSIGGEVLALPSVDTQNTSDVGKMVFLSVVVATIASHPLKFFVPFISTLLSFMGVTLYRYLAFTKESKPKKEVGVPKKKKNRKVGSKKAAIANNENLPDDRPSNEGGERSSLHALPDAANDHPDERKIGKLVVSNKEIAKGSNGTVVLEGIYDGRHVAVKRLLRTHHDVALKEIQNLIASDQHPNVVRWYGVEYDQDFVYLSLERCTCSLNDLIYICSESYQSHVVSVNSDSEISDEYTIRLHKIKENNKDIELWKPNGYPTPQLVKMMRDVVSGIAHLHELGIIHRDLKPQNVLVNKEKFLSAKLSDMGISKRLPGDMSSLTMHATGCGSSGWQAPEQLLRQRQTRAVDLFSLGCVLFFCVTGGKHPYGDSIERDVNIVHNRKDLFLVDNMPEAVVLFTHLLDPNPDMRPTASSVLHHPFFWSPETRLSFLRDVSDRVELEDRENDSRLLDALEDTAGLALNGKWDEKLETAFINNIGRYRRYKYDSVRDLLRVIRNKLNHYRELPPDIQELLGPVPEGFDSYFSTRFPKLLIQVHNVMSTHCREEECFLKYTTSNFM